MPLVVSWVLLTTMRNTFLYILVKINQRLMPENSQPDSFTGIEGLQSVFHTWVMACLDFEVLVL